MSCSPKNVRTLQNNLDGLADGLNQLHLKVTDNALDRALALLDLQVIA